MHMKHDAQKQCFPEVWKVDEPFFCALHEMCELRPYLHCSSMSWCFERGVQLQACWATKHIYCFWTPGSWFLVSVRSGQFAHLRAWSDGTARIPRSVFASHRELQNMWIETLVCRLQNFLSALQLCFEMGCTMRCMTICRRRVSFYPRQPGPKLWMSCLFHWLVCGPWQNLQIYNSTGGQWSAARTHTI